MNLVTVRTSLLFVALTVTAGAACGKKEESSTTGAAPTAKTADKAAAAPAAPAALSWKKIPSMGIEVEVAADADVQDNSASAGFPSATIYSTDGTPTTFIFGAKDLADSMALSKDFDATKTRVQKEMNGFKAFSKEEKVGEGFELFYTGASMTDPTQASYGVTIRSSAAGLTLECQTNADSEAAREKTVRLCKSIRAAK